MANNEKIEGCAVEGLEIKSDVDAIYGYGTDTKPVHDIPGAPDLSAIVVKKGYSVVSVAEYDKFRETPRRKTGVVTLHKPQSFIDYVLEHKDEGTVIFADLQNLRLEAVLNYHRANGEPRWGDHKAVYACRKTVEWTRWTGADNQPMSQETFSTFIEDNLPDIAEPNGAVILELAQELVLRKEVSFTGKFTPTSGARTLQYDETIDATTRRGDLKVPDSFTLGVAPFEGAERYQMKARLRFRAPSGKLSMWVTLDRPHAVVQTAFDAIVAKVENSFGDLLLVHGKLGA